MEETLSNKKPNRPPKAISKQEIQRSKNSFISRLAGMRVLLFRILFIILFFTVTAFLFKNIIFDDIILAPKKPDFITNRILHDISIFLGTANEQSKTVVFEIMNIEMAGQFRAHISISFILGLMISFPFITIFIWRFIKPLVNREYVGNINWILFFISILFALGVFFGYFIIVPLTLDFLGGYSVSDTVVNRISFRSYAGIITSVSFSIGLVFELPIIIYFLSKIGIASPHWLRKARKIAFVLFLALSAIITPPDVFSQILVCLPLILLYELSILLSGRVYRKRMKQWDDLQG